MLGSVDSTESALEQHPKPNPDLSVRGCSTSGSVAPAFPSPTSWPLNEKALQIGSFFLHERSFLIFLKDKCLNPNRVLVVNKINKILMILAKGVDPQIQWDQSKNGGS
jgi:hypothetical protein